MDVIFEILKNTVLNIKCLLPLIVFVPFFAFGILLKIIFYYINKDFVRRHWGEYARNRNLVLYEGSFFSEERVTGKYEGYDYLLYSKSISNSRRYRTYIVLTLPFTVDTGVFEFYSITRSFFLPPGEKVKTGDKDFDRKFSIMSFNPDKIRNFFTPGFRRRLMAFPCRLSVKVCNNNIICTIPFFVSDSKILDAVNELLVFIAGKLAGEINSDSETVCFSCGKEVLPYYKFCKYCGTSL